MDFSVISSLNKILGIPFHTFLQLYIFYLGFALCISIYRQWVKGTLNLYNKILFAPVLLWFGLLDIILNYTVVATAFGLPPEGAYTISTRFEKYRAPDFPDGIRKSVATFVCEKLLNTVDPSGSHC